MLSLSALSRRALVAATALGALAPRATAKKKKRKKPPPPPPPLAFAFVTLTDVDVDTAGPEPEFRWNLKSAVFHPASGYTNHTTGTQVDAVPTTTEAAQALIISWMRRDAAGSLHMAGIDDVPADRIAVILL